MATLRIFLSHSSHDDDFGARLVRDIRSVLGSEDAVWYDSRGGLHGGDSWWDKIVREVTAREVFLLVLSPEAMASYWVIRELDVAITQRKLVIPLLYRHCEVRPDLLTIQMIRFLPPKSYEAAFAELLTALGVTTSKADQYARERNTSSAQNRPKQEASISSQTATLHLIRESAFSDAIHAFHITLDDKKIGTIRNGESDTFEVEPGHHTIILHAGFASSPHLNFDIAPGENLTFFCRGKAGALKNSILLWKQ